MVFCDYWLLVSSLKKKMMNMYKFVIFIIYFLVLGRVFCRLVWYDWGIMSGWFYWSICGLW